MEYKDGVGYTFRLNTENHNKSCGCADCRWGNTKAPREKLILSWDSQAPTKLKMLVTGKWLTLGFDSIEECVAVMVVLHHSYEVYAQ